MSSISGEMAQLVCKVKGRPTPGVKWSLEGNSFISFLFFFNMALF